jgi:hypothetical protein
VAESSRVIVSLGSRRRKPERGRNTGQDVRRRGEEERGHYCSRGVFQSVSVASVHVFRKASGLWQWEILDDDGSREVDLRSTWRERGTARRADPQLGRAEDPLWLLPSLVPSPLRSDATGTDTCIGMLSSKPGATQVVWQIAPGSIDCHVLTDSFSCLRLYDLSPVIQRIALFQFCEHQIQPDPAAALPS